METVSFKVSPIVAMKLDELAFHANEKSRHLFARKIVEDFVNRTGEDETVQELMEIKQMIHELREDLATAVAALLVKAGKVKTLNEAKAWAKKKMVLGDLTDVVY